MTDQPPGNPPALARETSHLSAHGWRISPARALAAGALCWAGFAIIVWLVLTGQTGSLDEFGLLAAHAGSDRVLEFTRDTTALGGVFLRNLFALGAVAALLFLNFRREAVLFALTVIGGAIANSAVKALVGRERPQIVPHLMEATGGSFPSGHSFNAAVVYIAMALTFAAISRRHSVRYTIIGAAVIVSALVAWSRVMLGVHFPSDAIAGWLGGAGWAFVASALFYRPAKAAAER